MAPLLLNCYRNLFNLNNWNNASLKNPLINLTTLYWACIMCGVLGAMRELNGEIFKRCDWWCVWSQAVTKSRLWSHSQPSLGVTLTASHQNLENQICYQQRTPETVQALYSHPHLGKFLPDHLDWANFRCFWQKCLSLLRTHYSITVCVQ